VLLTSGPYRFKAMSSSLQNYLRSNRKRLGLSQDEVAFLLGAQSGAKICRYEAFVRAPTLKTALAFEAIFNLPANKLFKGLYEDICDEVTARAKALSYQIKYQKKDRISLKKRDALLSIVRARLGNSVEA
jgi:transcriptional regulator with XRE-family HTH domain